VRQLGCHKLVRSLLVRLDELDDEADEETVLLLPDERASTQSWHDRQAELRIVGVQVTGAIAVHAVGQPLAA
jgi:hypothetical protein